MTNSDIFLLKNYHFIEKLATLGSNFEFPDFFVEKVLLDLHFNYCKKELRV